MHMICYLSIYLCIYSDQKIHHMMLCIYIFRRGMYIYIYIYISNISQFQQAHHKPLGVSPYKITNAWNRVRWCEIATNHLDPSIRPSSHHEGLSLSKSVVSKPLRFFQLLPFLQKSFLYSTWVHVKRGLTKTVWNLSFFGAGVEGPGLKNKRDSIHQLLDSYFSSLKIW